MSLKRLTKILIFIFITITLTYRYFLYIDPINNCFVRLNPSFLEFTNVSIKKSIGILKRVSPEEYKKFCDNVNVIDPNPSCGGFRGGCFFESRPRTIDIGTYQGSDAWTAAVVAHETCHAIQSREKRPLSEAECSEVGLKVIKQIVEY